MSENAKLRVVSPPNMTDDLKATLGEVLSELGDRDVEVASYSLVVVDSAGSLTTRNAWTHRGNLSLLGALDVAQARLKKWYMDAVDDE